MGVCKLYYSIYNITEGSLEVKLPTIWTNEAAEAGTLREEKESEEKKIADIRSRHTKRWENRETLCFFQCFVPRRVESRLRRQRREDEGGHCYGTS